MPRNVLLIISFVFVAANPLGAQGQPKSKVDSNVTYSTVAPDKQLQMDIARPDGAGPYPAVLLIHGGAWRFGNRQELAAWLGFLASEGYVAAACSYRLLPDARFPEPLIDCKTAVRFLRKNADRYHIDKDKIGVVGFSAGGHLACMLGVTNKEAGFEGKEFADQSSRVQAVVSYFGPTDLSAYGNDDSAQNSTFEPLLGARFKDKPEVYKRASPISYVAKDDPPFLFLHGTKDWLVPIEQSRAMVKKLREAGVRAELVEVEKGGHGFEGADASKTTTATIKFLNDTLKK